MDAFFNRPHMKYQAKERLRGHWGTAIAITLIYMLLVLVISGLSGAIQPEGLTTEAYVDSFGSFQVSGATVPNFDPYGFEFETTPALITVGTGTYLLVQLIVLVLSLFLEGSYQLAYHKWSLDVQTGDPRTRFGDFVGNFRYAGKGILTYLWMVLWITIWSLVYLIPIIILGALIGGGAAMLSGQDAESMGPIVVILMVILMVVYFVLIIRKALSYSMMYFLVGDHPQEIGPIRAMNYSKIITKGHLGNLFVLGLSFIGWFLLTAITCGLASLYVIPYYNGTLAQAYLWLRDKAFANGLLMPEALGMQEEVVLVDDNLTQADLADASRYERVNTMADASPHEARDLDRTLDHAIEEDAQDHTYHMEEVDQGGPTSPDERNL